MRFLSVLMIACLFVSLISEKKAWGENHHNKEKAKAEKNHSDLKMVDPSKHAELIIQTNKSWHGTQLPPYPSEQPEITVLKLTIPPHSQLPVHKHPVINAAYVIKGEVVIFLENNNQSKRLKAGDVDIETVNTWYYGKNDTDKPTELIIFYAGTEGVPLTINKYTDK